MCPCLGFQNAIPCNAHQRAPTLLAIIEVADPVVGASEGHQVLHRGGVASLHVTAHELAALREADGVDGGRLAEDGVFCNLGACNGYLFCDVAVEGGRTVVATVFVKANVVSICWSVRLVQEFSDEVHAIRIIAISLALGPLSQGEVVYLSPRPCHVRRGILGDEAE